MSAPANQGGAARNPIYRISVDGLDITARVAGRLDRMEHTDNRGLEADQVEIVLDDTDGRLDLPPRGAKVRIAFGWPDTGIVDKGEFVVDEITHDGPPDRLTIRARSADLRGDINAQRERSWHDTTLGQVLRTIADEGGLIASIAPSLAEEPIQHLDQTNETNANLLTRLGRQFDAVATVKDGRLLFMPLAGGQSVSGQSLPAVVIRRQDGDRHTFSVADRETYTGVKALYNDVDHARKGEVVWGAAEDSAEHKAPAAKGAGSAIKPSADNVKTLRHAYASKANARRAARAEWRRLQRGVATFTLTLAHGRAELIPELPARIEGYKRQIDGSDWIVAKVTHSIGDSGFTTSIELEIKATEIPDD